jgi:hypothetical protein
MCLKNEILIAHAMGHGLICGFTGLEDSGKVARDNIAKV